MNFKLRLFTAAVALSAIALLPACKSKKAVVAPKPAPVVEEKPAPPPAPKPTPVQEKPAPPPPAPAPPNYNFSNILFEFDSGILKTQAYEILDKAVVEMKKDPSVKFMINGHSSAEGTAEHNLALSKERANSVKTYLVNSGISADNLTIKGWGESKPVSPNTDEASRALNRRVEIEKL